MRQVQYANSNAPSHGRGIRRQSAPRFAAAPASPTVLHTKPHACLGTKKYVLTGGQRYVNFAVPGFTATKSQFSPGKH